MAAENFGGGGLPGTLLGGGGRAGIIFPSTGLKIVQTIREKYILISLPFHPRYKVCSKETRFVMTWAVQFVVSEAFQEYMNSSDTDWDKTIKPETDLLTTYFQVCSPTACQLSGEPTK